MDTNKLFNLAQEALRAGRAPEARQLLIEVVRTHPNHEEAWLALASVVEDMDKAVDCLDRVLALNPNNTVAREWREFAVKKGTNLEPLQVDDVVIFQPGDDERPVPRLGQFLLEYKFVTEAQLKTALRLQQVAERTGSNRRLGELLLEQGAISEERLNFAVREQQRSFYSLFDDE